MELQVETLFRTASSGRWLAVNEVGDGRAPRLLLGTTVEGTVIRFRHDLPPALILQLEGIVTYEPLIVDPRLLPASVDRLSSVLAAHAPIANIWQGPAWYVPENVSASSTADAVAVTEAAVLKPHFTNGAYQQPCFAVLSDGVAVAVCESARTSARAAEAGVATALGFRGRGYASAVVASWARAVRESARVPLYSTSWDNHASQAVARRLGLVQYGVDFHIT